MGRGIDSYIKEQFGIAEVDIRTYSPLTLAYIGDGIYDLVIRSVVVGKGNTRAGELHKRTSQIVKAHTQAEMMEVLLPLLTEEELAFYKRGRNAHVHQVPKNATYAQYARATGLECLFGALYLTGQLDRLNERFFLIMEESHIKTVVEKKNMEYLQ